jgi:energy-coupling factor transporter ATP-binding protein EcfA2
MAQIELNKFSFKYPGEEKKALDNIDLSIDEGEFILICGPSGCGKTTFLQQLKKEICPEGEIQGKATYNGVEIMKLDDLVASQQIGMVFQEPESQIVTDSVCHELAFSMENMGYPVDMMRRRIGEMVHFFGIEEKMYESVHNLSGGQKQILNLASVLLLQPKVLLLDEPTSQLDPVSSREFIQMVYNLNRDFSITVLLSEHRLEEVFPIADRVVIMDEGRIKYHGTPRDVADKIYRSGDEKFFKYLPSITKLYFTLDEDKKKENIPFVVREGKKWVEGIDIKEDAIEPNDDEMEDTIMKLKDVSFKYEREKPFILRKLNFSINKGEILSILGGNGAGKSTLLKVMAGANKPQYGQVYLEGEKLYKMDERKRYSKVGYLAQNPMLYFFHDTVKSDIYDVAEKAGAKEEEVRELIKIFSIEDILDRHPYDISGGEKQKVALITVLLPKPEILLLDEPTKGIDPISKMDIGELIFKLKDEGITIVMATHDIEFAARFSDRCALIFDGDIACSEKPSRFFSENYFYTTTVNRVMREKMPHAVVWEDVINHGCIEKIH